MAHPDAPNRDPPFESLPQIAEPKPEIRVEPRKDWPATGILVLHPVWPAKRACMAADTAEVPRRFPFDTFQIWHPAGWGPSDRHAKWRDSTVYKVVAIRSLLHTDRVAAHTAEEHIPVGTPLTQPVTSPHIPCLRRAPSPHVRHHRHIRAMVRAAPPPPGPTARYRRRSSDYQWSTASHRRRCCSPRPACTRSVLPRSSGAAPPRDVPCSPA